MHWLVRPTPVECQTICRVVSTDAQAVRPYMPTSMELVYQPTRQLSTKLIINSLHLAFQSHPFRTVKSPMLQSDMGNIASRDTHFGLLKTNSEPSKHLPRVSKYLPRPSQREGARACGPGECSIASALAVNTARGVERASRFCACSRGLLRGDIWRNIGRASHFCARIRGNICGDIWKNAEFASNLRSPPSEGLGEVSEGLVSVSLSINLPASSASSTFSTLFVVFFCSCSCSLFLGTLTG